MAKKAAVKYRILSFDGGGLRGLLSLELLKRISEKTKDVEWYQAGQLFAGTSTGGLIAMALADGQKLEKIKEFYTDAGPQIFNRKTFYYFTSLLRFTHIGYKRDLLEKNLREMFREKKITELDKKVLVVTFDVNKEVYKGRFVWQPKIMHNFAPNADDLTMVETGLRTSAAPTYLPSRASFIDGGVCANNPSMCALAQIMNESGDAGEIDDTKAVLISVGTGNSPAPISERDLKWGILKWNTKLLKLLNDGGIKMVDYQCSRVLKDRYLRIDVDLAEKIDLDDVKKLDDIVRIAAEVPEAKIREWADWIDEHW
jgi:patatin-like phospholipase/acyl hydrolase